MQFDQAAGGDAAQQEYSALEHRRRGAQLGDPYEPFPSQHLPPDIKPMDGFTDPNGQGWIRRSLRRQLADAWIERHTPRNQMQQDGDLTAHEALRGEEGFTLPDELYGVDPQEREITRRRVESRFFSTPQRDTLQTELANLGKRTLMSQGPAIAGVTNMASSALGDLGGPPGLQPLLQRRRAQHERDERSIRRRSRCDRARASTPLGQMVGRSHDDARRRRIAGTPGLMTQGFLTSAGRTHDIVLKRLLEKGMDEKEARHIALLAGTGAGVAGAATTSLFGGVVSAPAARAGLTGVADAAAAGGTASAIGGAADRLIVGAATGEKQDYSGDCQAKSVLGAGVAGGLHALFNQFSNAPTARERERIADDAVSQSKGTGDEQRHARRSACRQRAS
jgi:hypothetical protein